MSLGYIAARPEHFQYLLYQIRSWLQMIFCTGKFDFERGVLQRGRHLHQDFFTISSPVPDLSYRSNHVLHKMTDHCKYSGRTLNRQKGGECNACAGFLVNAKKTQLDKIK